MSSERFADDPIVDRAEDLFDRSRFADQLASVILDGPSDAESLVYGLAGSWGSGKSSILHLVTQIVGGSNEWSVIRFNPWLFSDLESLANQFFSELASRTPSDAKKTLRNAVVKYGDAIAPLGKVSALFGFDGQKLVEGVTGFIRPDSSASARLAELEEALRAQSGKYLVVFDDVDRLEPRELLMVFKLVRLAGRLPRVYHLIAFDDETILDILERSEVSAGRRDRAHRYLEKIVQVRFDLPVFHHSEKRDLANSLLSTLFERQNITLTENQLSRFSEGFAEIENCLTQPRAVRRLVAQLHSTWPLVAGEVDFVDFFFVTFLRLFDPEVYRALPGRRAEIESDDLTWINEQDDSNSTLRTRSNLGTQLQSVLALFFPSVSTIAPPRLEVGARSTKRVADGDYFDRYFRLGIPRTDIADSRVEQAVNDISTTNSNSDAVTDLAGLFEVNGSLALRKIREHCIEGGVGDAEKVFDYLAEKCDITTATGRKMKRNQDLPQAATLGADLLRMLPEEDGASVLARVLDRGNLYYGAYVLSRGQEEDASWRAGNVTKFASATNSYIQNLGARPISSLSSDDLDILAVWGWFEQPEKMQEVLWGNIDGGAWDLSELLGELVQVSIDGGPISPPMLINLDISYLDSRLGTRKVVDRLRSELDALPLEDGLANTLASRQRRIDFALQELRRTSAFTADQPNV